MYFIIIYNSQNLEIAGVHWEINGHRYSKHTQWNTIIENDEGILLQQ